MFRLSTPYRVFVFLGVVLLSAPLLSAAGSVSAQAAPQLHVNQVNAEQYPNVALNVTLTGPDGKAIPNLVASQFEILEQNKPQDVVGFALGPALEVPLDMVLAMDISGSMNADNKLTQAKAAADVFLNSLRPQDKTSVVAFSDVPRVIIPATNDKGVLQAGINNLAAGGETAIYDALYRSAQILNAAPADHRRAVILLTDGADTNSQYSPDAATRVARDSGALVYTIGLGPTANDNVLTGLATPTGGKYYKAPSANDLNGIYAAISSELNSQLYLRYKSATRLQRSYELVHLQVKYKGPDGQIVSQVITYRPPLAAVSTAVTADSEPALPAAPVPTEVVWSPGRPAAPNMTSSPGGVPPYIQLFGVIAAMLASIGAIAGVFGLSLVFTPTMTSERMERYVAGPRSTADDRAEPGFVTRIVSPAIERIGKRLARLTPKGYTDHVESLLTLTGPPYRLRLGSFLGVQAAITLTSILVLLLWAIKSSPDAPSQWMLAIVLGLVIGIYFPYFWLKRKVTNRRRALLKALPGALDFLAINVEAGLGFDSALTQVVQRWHNTLTDEFALLLIDFQIGKPRKEAWRDLVQRTQVPELTSFVTAMLQNEQVGSSIGALLRIQADQMRVRRRQHAEEAARTAPVKMLIPMVFFIFPGIFVVILGPAVPQFLSTFLNFGK